LGKILGIPIGGFFLVSDLRAPDLDAGE
jgi:CBS domain-containing protein